MVPGINGARHSYIQVRENEHEGLLAAIEAGDGMLACQEMEQHLEHVMTNLQAYFAGRK